MVECGEPAIEEATGGSVGDQAHLVAEAGQANEDGGVNGADVVSLAGGHRSIGGITKDDGVDLGGIIFLVGSRGGPGCCAGGTGSAGAAGGEMCMSVVTQGIEDRGEHSDGGHGSEQDGSGAERLVADDVETGSGECGEVLGLSRVEPGWRSGISHIDSVDGIGNVSFVGCSIRVWHA